MGMLRRRVPQRRPNMAISNSRRSARQGLDYRGHPSFRRAGRRRRRVLEEAREPGAEILGDQSTRANAGDFEKKFYGPERVLFDIRSMPGPVPTHCREEIKEAAGIAAGFELVLSRLSHKGESSAASPAVKFWTPLPGMR